MGRFDGYGVLVTGAGRGIGEVVARRLAGEGARVLVTDADAGRAEGAAARVRAAVVADSPGGGLGSGDGPGSGAVPGSGAERSNGDGPGSGDGPASASAPEGAAAGGATGTAEAYVCDVGDQASVDAAVAHAVVRFGSLDVLVNNAMSCTPDTPFIEDQPEDSWQRDLDTTLTGAFRCVRAAMPHLAAAGDRGAVVNIGSVNGHQDFGNHAYSAAKAGLASLTRTLAVQSAERGVRVNLIAPGTVRTPNWDGREDALERAARVYPLGRVGRPEDIAAAVAFLASADASWITGVTLPVDGGLLISNAALRQAFRGD